MIDEALLEYKDKLNKKKEEILSRLKKQLDGQDLAREEGQDDLADRASQAYQSEYICNLTDNEQLVLQLIDESLDRIENGTYGFCVACSGKIQKKRLDVVPWARHCVHCQELQDEGGL